MSSKASCDQSLGVVNSMPDALHQDSSANRIHHNAHPAILLEGLNTLRNEESLTDISLVTEDGQQIACHRVVLAASIPYFKAMFTSGMQETKSQQVRMQGIAGSTLRLIVNYCYTGSFIITENNVEEVANASNILQFESLEEECARFLGSRLNATNSLETEMVGQRLFNRQLSSQAHDYSVGNFTDVTFSQEFLEFSEEQVDDFISENLYIDLEEEVYYAVMRWVKHDWENRNSYLSTLFTKVFFELMDNNFLLEIAAQEALLHVREAEDCLKIVKKALSFHKAHADSMFLPNSQSHLSAKVHTMRNFSEVMILIGEFRNQAEGLNPKSSNLLLYNPKSCKWEELPQSPFDGSWEFSTSATNINNDVLVLTSRHRAWLYITCEKKWSLLTNRMEHRNGECLVTHENQAFVLGGMTPVAGTVMTSVQYFQAVTKQWLDVSPMISGLTRTSAVDCLDKIYIIGSTGSRLISEMFCYSFHSDEWVKCLPLSQRLINPKMVAVKGCLYVLGHLDDFTMAMLKYDVIAATWSNTEAPLVARKGASVSVCNNKIYLFGGKVESNDYQQAYEFTIECYNPETEIWSIHDTSPWLLNGEQTVTVLNPSFPPALHFGPKKH
ncbi:kelch-like protein 30 [Asterias rubens]|uniref:kelch-like protein 30 n=1 Tax=Asterias rubens TaxID=7604 RepID=UPI001454EC05|nr:kelch-like protein 30 [Asterias rubens]XP_033637112.1 kelch-like protein 30 [Asterias rubens]XP_033637113.1 kelch-like protein 30 [Asterias rubens]